MDKEIKKIRTMIHEQSKTMKENYVKKVPKGNSRGKKLTIELNLLCGFTSRFT